MEVRGQELYYKKSGEKIEGFKMTDSVFKGKTLIFVLIFKKEEVKFYVHEK